MYFWHHVSNLVIVFTNNHVQAHAYIRTTYNTYETVYLLLSINSCKLDYLGSMLIWKANWFYIGFYDIVITLLLLYIAARAWWI